MRMGKVPSEFYIHHDKFQDLSNKALDWFIKGFKFDYGSDEWQICKLKQRIFNKEAMRHLELAQKYLRKYNE